MTEPAVSRTVCHGGTLARRKLRFCEISNVPYHKVVRVQVSNGNVDKVMEIKGLRRAVDDEVGTLLSVAPDGSVLLTRDVGTEEIYALGVNWP